MQKMQVYDYLIQKYAEGTIIFFFNKKKKICMGRNNAYTSKNVEQVRFPFRNKPMKR